jgi:hypothetical protein
MKRSPQYTALMLAGITLLVAGPMAPAQITVKVDSTKNWLGWMNVFNMDNSYAFGQAWAPADLRAAFEPARSNATRVVLRSTPTRSTRTATGTCRTARPTSCWKRIFTWTWARSRAGRT